LGFKSENSHFHSQSYNVEFWIGWVEIKHENRKQLIKQISVYLSLHDVKDKKNAHIWVPRLDKAKA
jgi:hypothetical protein